MSERSPRAARFGGVMYRKRRNGVRVAALLCALSYSTISGGGLASIGKSERT